MTRPTISVVVPTFNRRAFVRECLASVAAQRLAPHEVIVVDDGSTDGTADALACRPGLTFLVQANAGAGAARNRGAAAATGDYLAFLDSDDLWFPWTLAAIAALIERHRGPTLLAARFANFAGEVPAPAEEPVDGEAFAHALDASVFVGSGTMVVQREAFLAAGGFVEHRLNAEDHDLALRLCTAPGLVRVRAPVMLARRLHAGNAIADVGRTVAGVAHLVATERAGGYPGGPARQAARRAAIAAHVRPAVVAAVRSGHLGAALRLYRDTFAWNARDVRGRFLAGVPALIARGALAGWAGRRTR